MNTAGLRTLAFASPPFSASSGAPISGIVADGTGGLATGANLEARMSASGRQFWVTGGPVFARLRPAGFDSDVAQAFAWPMSALRRLRTAP